MTAVTVRRASGMAEAIQNGAQEPEKNQGAELSGAQCLLMNEFVFVVCGFVFNTPEYSNKGAFTVLVFINVSIILLLLILGTILDVKEIREEARLHEILDRGNVKLAPFGNEATPVAPSPAASDDAVSEETAIAESQPLHEATPVVPHTPVCNLIRQPHRGGDATAYVTVRKRHGGTHKERARAADIKRQPALWRYST
eukprot:NODE_509_length_1860_cov_90.991344_g501_i0.p2 GENE.NODE_509_length_1860_cov_90.991344_g501_i0~~NODE_509_length_1860_cov_90.991344_g501_i0.p2  ORF type:complete len:198 (-),score=34.59 NODE_509_length_1860_cov_90.991344_g501_i0:226-819(-)